jgi:hypothetical protein
MDENTKEIIRYYVERITALEAALKAAEIERDELRHKAERKVNNE